MNEIIVINKILEKGLTVTFMGFMTIASIAEDEGFSEVPIIKEMIDNDLLVTGNNGKSYSLTVKGNRIAKLPNKYQDYLDIQNKDLERQANKAFWDAQYSYWLYKFRWWPIIISLAAILISTFALFKSS